MRVSNVSDVAMKTKTIIEYISFILGQKEGHKSFECPEGGQGGGNRSGTVLLHSTTENIIEQLLITFF